jgi:hypothetical protein
VYSSATQCPIEPLDRESCPDILQFLRKTVTAARFRRPSNDAQRVRIKREKLICSGVKDTMNIGKSQPVSSCYVSPSCKNDAA